jgi:hypothetical protein
VIQHLHSRKASLQLVYVKCIMSLLKIRSYKTRYRCSCKNTLNLFTTYYNLLIDSSYRLTVRTLDFHSNNVGSIPASLIFMQKFIISNRKKIQKQSVFSNQKFNKLRYSLNFKTIIPPTQVAVNSLNLQTSFEKNSTISSKKSGKLLIKQSYLLLT